MDLILTDVLACPRCGPPFGLVLLADAVEERRVLEGVLGCPNCHARYPVRSGLADLRAPAEVPAAAEGAQPVDEAGADPAAVAGTEPGSGAASERAVRLAALMGLEVGGVFGRHIALLVGPAAALAPVLAALSEELEVVAAGPPAAAGRPDAPRVSRALVSGKLPFLDRSLRGVTLSGGLGARLVEEGLRVLHPLGRLVLEDAGADARARVERAGGRVLAAEGRTLVAGVVG